MLDLYEKLAIKIKALEPFLSIIGAVLFFSMFIIPHVLPIEQAFVVGLIMLWVCGIALVGHMFAPQTDHDGNQTPSRARRSSDFNLDFGLIFISFWFLALFFITIRVVMMLFG